jgi:hypothetical protein
VLYQQGSLLDMVDASIEDYPKEEVLRFIPVGLACTQVTPSSRPTMRQAVVAARRPARAGDVPTELSQSAVPTPPPTVGTAC